MRPREELWRSIGDVYSAIISHPFLKGLCDGTLPIEKFKFYVLQDYLYLDAFARAVATVGSKAKDDSIASFLFECAKSAYSVERKSLHEYLMREWGINEDVLETIEPSPLNYSYMNFLLYSTLAGSFEEGLGAILPCFWIYREVGRELSRRSSPTPEYRRWIDTYSSPEYELAVDELLDISDVALSDLPPKLHGSVLRNFRISAVYEYMFWDSAHKMEGWPFRLR